MSNTKVCNYPQPFVTTRNHSKPPTIIENRSQTSTTPHNHPQTSTTTQKLPKKAETCQKLLCCFTVDVNTETDVGSDSDMKHWYI